VILVIAEQRDGKLNRASWEAVAAAQALGGPITLGAIGAGVDAVAQELSAAGVGNVLVADHAAFAFYTPDGYVAALDALIKAASPTLVVMAHTYQARDFAPLAAARFNQTLVTDVTAVSGTAAEATFTRPMFQGKLAAQVKALGEGPAIVTMQIGALRADAVKKGSAASAVSKVDVKIEAATMRQKPEAPFQEAKAAVDLSQAERIVSVGRGIKAQDKLPVAESLARALGAELAASRPICDNGWLPMDRQIGSSGQTVAPKLYVALGISGAIQHLVGMKGSRTIVAINKDAEAPIFEVADYGIVGDLFEIVPAIVAEIEK
jgi:electron transfer flavoprotein alpha subunit